MLQKPRIVIMVRKLHTTVASVATIRRVMPPAAFISVGKASFINSVQRRRSEWQTATENRVWRGRKEKNPNAASSCDTFESRPHPRGQEVVWVWGSGSPARITVTWSCDGILESEEANFKALFFGNLKYYRNYRNMTSHETPTTPVRITSPRGIFDVCSDNSKLMASWTLRHSWIWASNTCFVEIQRIRYITKKV